MTLISLEATALVMRVAAATVGAMEKAKNTGPYVERLLKQVGAPPGSPWCAAYVYDVGQQALGGRWPCVRTASCAALGVWAEAHKVLKTEPAAGDVMLIYHPELGRFAHTGFVVSVLGDHGPVTISGNTTVPGGGGDPREGWAVVRKPWVFKHEDRFIRWDAALNP